MTLEAVAVCPVCNGSQFSPFLSCKDHTTSGEKFNLVRCNSCSLLITNPRPDSYSIGSYYQSQNYISHSGSTHTIGDQLYLLLRKFTIQWKSKLVRTHSSKVNGSLLDFGCGTGEFVNQMSVEGWQCSGVEPSDNARLKAKQLTGLNIESSIDQLPNSKFDVVTLWHVLEHIADVKATLKQIITQVHPNGIIFVAVPNHKSKDAEYYQNLWAGYDVPRHLWHFSQSSMSLLLASCNLKLLEIIPMKLDAYYVSLLSEQYKRENKNSLAAYLSALRQGMKSNLSARKNKNYSSLIYVAKI